MKIKFLFAAALCAVLPLSAGCNTDYYENSEDVSNYSAESNLTENSSESTDNQSEVTVMYITINSIKIEAELTQNSSVTALTEILKQNDITYTATDYGNFEKVGNIGYSLPQNNETITTQPGDVILYQGNNICLYYGTNTWSFTRIGKINGYSEEELKAILCAGDGSVQITLSLN